MTNTEGFSFCLSKEGEEEHVAGRAAASVLLFLGLGACAWGCLDLSETGCSPSPLAVAGILYCIAGGKLPRRALAFQAAAVAALVIYSVVVSQFIISGWNVVMNGIFRMLETRLGYIFPRYEVTETGQPEAVCAELFLVLPAVLLGLLSARTVSGRSIWLLPTTVLLAGLWALGASALYLPDWRWVLLALGLAVLGAWRLLRANVTPGGIRLVLSVAAQAGLVLLLCAVPASLWNTGGEAKALTARRAAESRVHQMRYEEAETTLPEGNFKDLKGFAPRSTAALRITMEKPQEMYLRGYVGEVYTGSGWTGLDPARKAEYATLFSWLHARGFYGQEQYALLCQALGASEKSSAVSIQVLDACTGWRYAPYGLSDADADPRQIGDADWPAGGLRGERSYTYTTSGCPVSDYERMADTLTQARESGSQAAIDYLTDENAYREFVYANYLDVPDEARAAIGSVFRGLDLPKEGRVSFRDAQMVVRAYLSSIVRYSETPEPIGGDKDFLSGFLEETKEGYSVHYATAAALMFRYLGVPARYVEGWYIPDEKAEEMTPGEPAELDQSSAHAWVEIYRDGVGFVPFEITPPYTDPMEQSDLTQGGSGGAEVPPPEEDPEPPEPRQIALVFLWILLAMVLVLAATAAVRRCIRRRRVRKMLEDPDPSAAVSNMTTWAVGLLGYLGVVHANGSLYGMLPELEGRLGKELAGQYRLLLEAQRQAVFSRSGVSDAERELPRRFLAQLETALKRRSTFAERMHLRWVKCVI